MSTPGFCVEFRRQGSSWISLFEQTAAWTIVLAASMPVLGSLQAIRDQSGKSACSTTGTAPCACERLICCGEWTKVPWPWREL